VISQVRKLNNIWLECLAEGFADICAGQVHPGLKRKVVFAGNSFDDTACNPFSSLDIPCSF
jgi:hypothetical protein